MRANLEVTHGALFSQRVLLALVADGATRDDAYRVAQELAQRAWAAAVPVEGAARGRPRATGLDLDAIFDYGHFVPTRQEILARLDAIA